MTQEFDKEEHCECKENEREHRRIIRIELSANGKALNVMEIRGGVQEHEIVNVKQVTTPFGRSYEELAELGPGLHSICDCKPLGPKGSVSTYHRE